eukprot:2530614-Rhodomonas_salina.1
MVLRARVSVAAKSAGRQPARRRGGRAAGGRLLWYHAPRCPTQQLGEVRYDAMEPWYGSATSGPVLTREMPLPGCSALLELDVSDNGIGGRGALVYHCPVSPYTRPTQCPALTSYGVLLRVLKLGGGGSVYPIGLCFPDIVLRAFPLSSYTFPNTVLRCRHAVTGTDAGYSATRRRRAPRSRSHAEGQGPSGVIIMWR